MPLRCLHRYQCIYTDSGVDRRLSYTEGELVDEPAAIEAWLLADAPACFETLAAAANAQPETRALDAAPHDRMIAGDEPPVRKRATRKVAG